MDEIQHFIAAGLIEKQRGHLVVAQRLFDEAVTAFDRAHGALGGDPALHDQRGALLERIGRIEGALDELRAALECERTPDRCYRYGKALSQLGRFGEALPFLEQAVLLNPLHAEAIIARGVTRLEMGRTDLAREDFDLAIRLAPELPEAWAQQGVWHFLRGEWEQVTQSASRAIALAPGNPLPYKLRARAYQEMGRCREAIADLERLFALNPTADNQLRVNELLMTGQASPGRGWRGRIMRRLRPRAHWAARR
ncbi:MAG: tetratricopeptide repeat protein [Blastocatellia bacterium]|nr:tetratricopeptide repeat protein [Blastocatellia bacterium]